MPESPLRELLRSYQERGVAAEFCQYVLGTLVAYDRAHNADLLHTLRTYFRCNGNAIEAARTLFLHRNSLQYRLDRIEEVFGGDPWPYGIEPNRPTLEAFLQYAFEQGICRRRLAPQELFAPETLETFKI